MLSISRHKNFLATAEPFPASGYSQSQLSQEVNTEPVFRVPEYSSGCWHHQQYKPLSDPGMPPEPLEPLAFQSPWSRVLRC